MGTGRPTGRPRTEKPKEPSGRGPGRPKGSKNRSRDTLLLHLRREFPGYHPVVAMAKIANNPKSDERTRFDAHKEVAKYVTPQLKAVEITGADGAPIQAIISADPMSPEEWEKQHGNSE